MANYNTFLVVNCKTRRPTLVTSSARKARDAFGKGVRVEVWNENRRVETIRFTDLRTERHPFAPYIQQEMDYIADRQRRAEQKNRRRNGGMMREAFR
jgi:hypothetical protein